MEINVQSIKFDADQKLLDFVDKKFAKLKKFYDEASHMDVSLSLLSDPDNKKVKVRVVVPGAEDIIVERNADTFENAITECAGILKDRLVQAKEKRFR